MLSPSPPFQFSHGKKKLFQALLMVKLVQKPASVQQLTAAAAVITALFSILLLMVSPKKLSFNV